MEEVLVYDPGPEVDEFSEIGSSGEYSLITIYLPLHYNNGDPMDPQRLEWALDMLLKRFGGLTRYQPGVGFWVGPAQKVFRDSVLPVLVVAPAGPETSAWFSTLAANLAVLLEQSEIFLFALPVLLVPQSS